MGEQQKLLEIVLFSFKAGFDGCQLAVVAYSFLLEPPDDLIVGLLYRLRFVILDHDLVQPIFEQPYCFHHGILLNVAQFVILYLLQLILEGEEYILLHFGLVLLLVEHDPEIVLVHIAE